LEVIRPIYGNTPAGRSDAAAAHNVGERQRFAVILFLIGLFASIVMLLYPSFARLAPSVSDWNCPRTQVETTPPPPPPSAVTPASQDMNKDADPDCKSYSFKENKKEAELVIRYNQLFLGMIAAILLFSAGMLWFGLQNFYMFRTALLNNALDPPDSF
jgi:hypothetical protein